MESFFIRTHSVKSFTILKTVLNRQRTTERRPFLQRSFRGLCSESSAFSTIYTFFFDECIFYWLTVTTPFVFNLHDFGCTYISGCKCISDLMSSGYVCLSIPGWFTKLLSLKMPWSLYCPNWMLSWKKWDFKHSTQTTKTWIGRWLEKMWVFRSTKVMTFLNWQINN